MKILHITDSHGTVKTPESRKDLYYLTFLRKMAEIKYIIQYQHIDMIIHTGDLFHTSRVSNKFMGQVAEIIKTYNVPFYVVPGNHDIDGYTINTIDQTSLGLFVKTGVVKLLDRDNPIAVNTGEFTIAISGQEYYADIDTGNMKDFEMQQPEADINILAIHGYIADTQQHPNIRCTYPKDIITDADIILSGHYHRQFEVIEGDVAFYNPGSMLRVEQTSYNEKHMPQYGILDITLDKTTGYVNYDYKFHQFRIARPSTEVFDYTLKNAVKSHGITLENFKNSIATTMSSITTNVASAPDQVINQIIDDYIASGVAKHDKNTLYIESQKVYTNALQNVQDDDVISTKGFIPAQDNIMISAIKIHNFQSHEDTVINFSDGLNILVGESSNGKTSVIRAIQWVYDNQPLGNSFIMTGKKECYVRIMFSDGSFVERGRTLKDTGYYRIGSYNAGETDIDGKFTIDQEFKGFTNNIPVEVMNIHQTPRINITKSLETHLNMITQLERPFLITESVNDKAIAIGRITGTNVVDESIKESQAEVVADTKYLKTLTTSLEKLEAQRDAIDINAVKQKGANAALFVQQLNNGVVKYDKLNKIMLDAGTIQSDMLVCKNMIRLCDDVIQHRNLADEYDALLAKATALIRIKKQYEAITQDTVTQKKAIKEAEDLLTVKSMVDYIDLQGPADMIRVIKNYRIARAGYMQIQQQVSECDEIINCKDLIDKMDEGFGLVSKVIRIRKDYNNANTVCNNIISEISNIDSEIESINEQIETVNTERTEYILQQGVCPCCGQKVTQKHIANIIANMEE